MMKNWVHIVRSALIGVGIGAVPGIGEDIAGLGLLRRGQEFFKASGKLRQGRVCRSDLLGDRQQRLYRRLDDYPA